MFMFDDIIFHVPYNCNASFRVVLKLAKRQNVTFHTNAAFLSTDRPAFLPKQMTGSGTLYCMMIESLVLQYNNTV